MNSKFIRMLVNFSLFLDAYIICKINLETMVLSRNIVWDFHYI